MVDQAAKEPLPLDTDGGLTESDDSLTLVRQRGGVSNDEDSGVAPLVPRLAQGGAATVAAGPRGRRAKEGASVPQHK